jgi:hypothetical protein
MYSLSKEGRGSGGSLVTALSVAICEAAEERAKVSPGGRLAVPLVVVLDEAANVCRWRELPNLYSHYGSRVPICARLPAKRSVSASSAIPRLVHELDVAAGKRSCDRAPSARSVPSVMMFGA